MIFIFEVYGSEAPTLIRGRTPFNIQSCRGETEAENFQMKKEFEKI